MVMSTESLSKSATLQSLIHRRDKVLAVLHPPTAAHARIMEKAGCEALFVGTGGVVGAYTGLAEVGTAIRVLPMGTRIDLPMFRDESGVWRRAITLPDACRPAASTPDKAALRRRIIMPRREFSSSDDVLLRRAGRSLMEITVERQRDRDAIAEEAVGQRHVSGLPDAVRNCPATCKVVRI
jgi:hypothetical protein